jgi:hypothetical protein
MYTSLWVCVCVCAHVCVDVSHSSVLIRHRAKASQEPQQEKEGRQTVSWQASFRQKMDHDNAKLCVHDAYKQREKGCSFAEN